MISQENKARILLMSLLDGNTVRIGGDTYGMSEEFEPLIEGKVQRLGDSPAPPETVWLRTHMSVSAFVRLAGTMTDEEAMVASSERVLQEINRAGGLARYARRREAERG